MKLKSLLTLASLAIGSAGYAQETADAPLQISGSVDTYYKYDFEKRSNIPTYFGSDHNSVSLGMIDLVLKKTTGKASFVGELSFGPRGQYQSIPNSDGGYIEGDGYNSFHIQNLYASYAFTDKFSMTAGYMGTFIGYEVIAPTGNYNYSTSYLFSYGPFQNAGIKGTYAFSSKASLMVGLFNDWNVYSDNNGVSHIGAQLMLSPVEGWTAYLNVLSGKKEFDPGTGTVLDLTTSYQVTENFKIGLNAADYSIDNDGAGAYSGAALYLQNSFTPGFGLGLRGEYFNMKGTGGADDESVTAVTLSGNFKAGGLTFIPEVRFDNGSSEMFAKSNLTPSKSASQFSLALVYAF
ncbi:porin [Pedobacter metabolipauper]|uniref:Putative OmpL-like beta-barrel porin-2 n=1 Tax=Pedobacter metabolipauper TaxID=425513 RepID=A0A4R6STH9_9SPHI|nr:porin [Pedobacter metabolipauper]TDQ07354.1 putative OmpL-like beta-barrel porin-2 [Pedobacter metabolipauper]